MRAALLFGLVLGLVGLGFLACNPNSIGRPCVNPADAGVQGTQLVSPALECPSRLCLLTPGQGADTDGGASADTTRATCTAGCENQDDCAPETDKNCPSKKFVCAVATRSGPFCCKKYCICADDLEEGVNKAPNDGGVVIPPSCIQSQTNPTPSCPNFIKQQTSN